MGDGWPAGPAARARLQHPAVIEQLGQFEQPERRRPRLPDLVTLPNVVAGHAYRTINQHPIRKSLFSNATHISPLNPWLHLYYVVTGVNSYGQQVNPGEQLTREQALRLRTRESAWHLRMEDRLGSIEPGRLADLAVLDRDYFSVPDEEIKKIRSVLTMVDGKIVHRT